MQFQFDITRNGVTYTESQTNLATFPCLAATEGGEIDDPSPFALLPSLHLQLELELDNEPSIQYTVLNDGQVAITGPITIQASPSALDRDFLLVQHVACPLGNLAVGESMHCSSSIIIRVDETSPRDRLFSEFKHRAQATGTFEQQTIKSNIASLAQELSAPRPATAAPASASPTAEPTSDPSRSVAPTAVSTLAPREEQTLTTFETEGDEEVAVPTQELLSTPAPSPSSISLTPTERQSVTLAQAMEAMEGCPDWLETVYRIIPPQETSACWWPLASIKLLFAACFGLLILFAVCWLARSFVRWVWKIAPHVRWHLCGGLKRLGPHPFRNSPYYKPRSPHFRTFDMTRVTPPSSPTSTSMVVNTVFRQVWQAHLEAHKENSDSDSFEEVV